jgi:class 3 adenylate cyclase
VAEVIRKSLHEPEQVVEFPNLRLELVTIGDLTVAYMVNQPGWRWSKDVRPTVGGEWCQVRHVGVVISGSLGIEFADGSSVELRPGDVFDIPPGHDGYTVGDEPIVQIEWTGVRAWAAYGTGLHTRVLATLVFADLVSSTELAARLGDAAWRDRLSHYFEAIRVELERFGGREVKTTGDGMLATFDGSARALHWATAVRRLARTDELQVRVGVHVGEVELVGDDVRGVTVHEAARIMAAAEPDEILVCDVTRALAGASGLGFVDRGPFTLKGLEGEWRLAAVVDGDAGG